MHASAVHGGSWRRAPLALLFCFAVSVHADNGVEASRGPRVHTVVIEAMKFAPEVLHVRRGDTVIWVNRDPFPHNVTAQDGVFASGPIPAGASWKHVTSRKGSSSYLCTLHPSMKAGLVVD